MKKLFVILILAVQSWLAFGQATDASLTAQSNVIRDETQPGGNTKTRIAAMFQSIIDSKVSILAPRLTTTSTNGYVWTAVGTTGLGSWQPATGGGGGGSVNSVSGTSNRITSTGGTDPVIDIAGTYVGQTSITTLGTLTTASGNITLWTNNAGYITGNQTITLSGDVSGSGTTAITTAIGANKVTLPMLAQVSTARFLGRTTAGTGDVESLTGTQATALLDVVTSGAKGLAPASGGGTTNFLRADGTWTTPSASVAWGGITGTLSSQTDLQTALDGKWSLASGGILTGTNTISHAGFDVNFTGIGTVGFSATATQPGMNVGSFAGTPGALDNGDVWYNSTANHFIGRQSAANKPFMQFNTATITGNRVPYAANSTGFQDDADLTFDGAGLLVGAGTITANTRTDIRGISGGNATRIADNTNAPIITVLDDAHIQVGANANNFIAPTTGNNAVDITGTNMLFSAAGGSGQNKDAFTFTPGQMNSTSTGSQALLRISNAVMGAGSGSNDSHGIRVNITFNQSGTSTGVLSSIFLETRHQNNRGDTYGIVYRSTTNFWGTGSSNTGNFMGYSNEVTVNQTSGTGSVTSFMSAPTATLIAGTFRGFYHNPAVTSITGAHYSFEATSGTMLLPASVAGAAPLRLPHGTAPSSPVNGDIWTTTSSAFARINGVTVDLAAGGGGGLNFQQVLGVQALSIY